MVKNYSPQSKRLKAFIDTTGMSLTEFAKQCKIPSTSSIHNVVSLGKTPSTKLLDKIITRFPQLNHDWVLLGYGQMIVQGMQKQPANAISVKKSMEASYQNIQENLENHDFAMNYLSTKIEKALISSAKTFQQVNERLDNFEQNQKIFIKYLHDNREKVVGEINHLLDVKLKEMRADVMDKSDANTQRAIDFLLSIKSVTYEKSENNLGEFVKHTNPKPEK